MTSIFFFISPVFSYVKPFVNRFYIILGTGDLLRFNFSSWLISFAIMLDKFEFI